MIKNQIKKDLLEARKNRHSFKVTALSTLLGELERVDANKLTTSVEVGIIKKYLANLLPLAQTSDLADLEYALVEQYLPNQMTNEDIVKVLANLPDKSLKAVMLFFKNNYDGLYDAAVVSKLVQNG